MPRSGWSHKFKTVCPKAPGHLLSSHPSSFPNSPRDHPVLKAPDCFSGPALRPFEGPVWAWASVQSRPEVWFRWTPASPSSGSRQAGLAPLESEVSPDGTMQAAGVQAWPVPSGEVTRGQRLQHGLPAAGFPPFEPSPSLISPQ